MSSDSPCTPGPAGGTRLTLWNNIGRNDIAMGEADALKFTGWQRHHSEYKEIFHGTRD